VFRRSAQSRWTPLSVFRDVSLNFSLSINLIVIGEYFTLYR